MGARAKHVYGKGEAHVGEKIRARVVSRRGRSTYWTSAGHMWGQGEDTCGGKGRRAEHVWGQLRDI